MMNRSIIAILVVLGIPAALHAQEPAAVRALLDEAAARFDIPPPVLYAVAYNESRWQYDTTGWSELRSGSHRPHGVMGLRDDLFFGHSLRAGEVLGITPEQADTGLRENILAGAYRLSGLFDGANRAEITSWYPAIANYSGYRQEPIRRLYLDGVVECMHQGWALGQVTVAPVNVPGIDRAKLRIDLLEIGVQSFAGDYQAAVWMPSPNFSSRNGTPITHVAIHDTEGNFAGSVAWLSDTAAQASAHYVIRSIDGYIVQLVRETDKAWHIRTENPYSIGIEHEGYVAKPQFFTKAMYNASSQLVRYLTDKYNIPLDRTHVKGHLDFQNNTHTDPGGWWDWPGYYRMVSGDNAMRVVLDPFEDNVVGWWPPQMSGSTIGVDTSATDFAVLPGAAHTGLGGGRLTYAFSDASGGLARVFRSGHGNVTDGQLFVGTGGFVTLAVRGDGSGNELELWFYDSSRAVFSARMGAVDWTDWRTVRVDVAKLGGRTPMRFCSVSLRQVPGKTRIGTIDVDDLAHEVVPPSDVAAEAPETGKGRARIEGDRLRVSWPPSVGTVRVVMTDVLGRQVFRRDLPAIDDGASWDIRDLPSGLFLVSVRTGTYIRTDTVVR